MFACFYVVSVYCLVVSHCAALFGFCCLLLILTVIAVCWLFILGFVFACFVFDLLLWLLFVAYCCV